MNFIDAHAHLTMVEKKLEKDLDILHLKKIIDIGLYPNDFEERKYLLEKYDNVILALALYPSIAEKTETEIDQDLENLKKDIIKNRKNIYAIGECGYDFFHNFGTAKKQEQLFRGQLELAREFKLPVIIHSRDADKLLLETIKDYKDVLKILHCFSSDYTVQNKALDLNCCISFCGNLTFKNSKILHEASTKTPMDKLLFETDSPFLAPVPKRGKINSSENVEYVYRFFSEYNNIDLEKLCEQVENNFNSIFLQNTV